MKRLVEEMEQHLAKQLFARAMQVCCLRDGLYRNDVRSDLEIAICELGVRNMEIDYRAVIDRARNWYAEWYRQSWD